MHGNFSLCITASSESLCHRLIKASWNRVTDDPSTRTLFLNIFNISRHQSFAMAFLGFGPINMENPSSIKFRNAQMFNVLIKNTNHMYKIKCTNAKTSPNLLVHKSLIRLYHEAHWCYSQWLLLKGRPWCGSSVVGLVGRVAIHALIHVDDDSLFLNCRQFLETW